MTENQQKLMNEYDRLKQSGGVKKDALIKALSDNHGMKGMTIGAIMSGLRNAGKLKLSGDYVEVDMSGKLREAVSLAQKTTGGATPDDNAQNATEIKGEGKEIQYEEHVVNRPWGNHKQLRGCLDCKFYKDDEKKPICRECTRDRLTGQFTNWVWEHEEHIVEIIKDQHYMEYPEYDKVLLRIPKGTEV